MARSLLALGGWVLMVAAGCGGNGSSPCDNVRCAGTERCDPDTGRCVSGDTCASAIPMDLSSGSSLVSGAIGANDPDHDTYYRIKIDHEAALNADASSGQPFFAPRVELLTADCNAPERFAPPVGLATGQLRDVYLAPGTYLVRVSENLFGSFSLHVWLTAATRAPGNSCLAPIVVTLDGSGAAHLTGTTAGMLATTEDNCRFNRPAPPSIVYELDLPVRSHVAYTVTPTDPALDVDAYWLTSCFFLDGSCSTLDRPGDPDGRILGPVDAGRYFLLVRTERATGPFRVDIQVIPWATNDTCKTAQPLVFTNDIAQATGDLRYAGSETCACSSIYCNVHHQAYRFSTAGLGNRSIAVEIRGTGWSPQGAIVSPCGIAIDGTVLACDGDQSDSTALVEAPRLAEGDYFIQVGGEGSGPFTLTARLGPSYAQPANDTCDSADPIDLTTTSSVVRTGDTRGAANDLSGICEPYGDPGQGNDVAYLVSAPGRGSVQLTVTPTDGALDPVLRVDSTCPSFTSTSCVNANTVGQSERLLIKAPGNTASESFYAWVDGAARTKGTFQLTADFLPPPSNDTCTSQVPVIAVGTPATGDTSLAYNDNPCGDINGPDVYYQFKPPSNGTYTFTLTPSGFDGALALLPTCASTTCMAVAQAGGVGAVETMTVTLSRNTTYFVAVESAFVFGGGGGTYSLTVTGP